MRKGRSARQERRARALERLLKRHVHRDHHTRVLGEIAALCRALGRALEEPAFMREEEDRGDDS